MKRAFTFFILFCFVGLLTSAQELSRTVIAPQGDYSLAGDMSLEWTIGETFIEYAPTRSLVFTQGFHQPMMPLLLNNAGKQSDYFSTLYSSNMRMGKPHQVDVYPNPFFNVLHVAIHDVENSAFIVRLLDVNGMILQEMNYMEECWVPKNW